MFRAAGLAFADLFDHRFRLVLLQALGLTLLLLVGLGAAGHWAIGALPHFKAAWLNPIVSLLGDAGVLVGGVVLAVLLAVPVASLFVCFFLDGVARRVEAKRYPQDPPGTTLAIWPTLTTGVSFLVGSLVINLPALPLYFIPGVGAAVWLLVNGWLLGRQYFELAALRHVQPGALKALRRRYRFRILVSGILIALALSIPIVNLLAPLFGTAFMVHLFKGLEPPT